MSDETHLTVTVHQALPVWMRRSKRGYDRGFLLILLLSLLPALSFLLQPGVAHTNDLERYIFQVENSAQALSEGRLYARWSPNALSGYGAPIPHFSPPLPVYFSGLVKQFVTGNAISAVKIVTSIALMSAGVFIYGLVHSRSGAVAGLIAGILYLYSPYVGLVVPYLAGDLPLIVLAALLPAWLWSIQRLQLQAGRTNIILASLLSASLMLTKSEAAVVGYIFAVVLWASQKKMPTQAAGWGWLFIVIVLGIGMASFFWMPALIEADKAQWVVINPSLPHALRASSLFAIADILNSNELNPQPYFALGSAQILCAVASTIIVIRWRQWRTLQAYFLGLAAILCFIAVVFLSHQVWLLCPIALCIAIGGSGVAGTLEHSRRYSLIVVTLITALIVLSVPVLHGVRWSDIPFDTSPAAEVNFERFGFGIASLPDGQAVATNLDIGLLPNQPLINGYATGDILKIDPDASASRAQVGVLAHSSHTDRFQLFTASPTVVRVLTNYFPGWFAMLNGTETGLQPSPEGLLDVTLNERSGELVVEFGATLPRTLAWFFSWTFMAITIIIASRRPLQKTSYDGEESTPLRRNVVRALIVIILGTYLILVALILPVSPFSTLLTTNEPAIATTSLTYRTSEGLEASSYTPFSSEIAAGTTLDFTVFWRALRFLPANYRAQLVLINLADATETLVSPSRHIGGLPTQRWATQRTVIDPYSVILPPSLSDGEYALALDVFACDDQRCTPGERLAFFDPQGTAIGERIVFPQNLVIR